MFESIYKLNQQSLRKYSFVFVTVAIKFTAYKYVDLQHCLFYMDHSKIYSSSYNFRSLQEVDDIYHHFFTDFI